MKKYLLILITFLTSVVAMTGCSNGGSGTVPTNTNTSGGLYGKISGGANHTCGIDSTSQVKCWGSNIYGQLGDGTTIDRLTSTYIDSGVIYTEVSAAEGHTCAITSGGVLKCWGLNNYGQLGDATNTNRLVPTVIDSGVSYTKISTAGHATCGITSAADLKCWGFNSNGGLGDGTVNNKNIPTLIDGPTTYAFVSAGGLNTCGITTAGVLKCWGANGYGQLGDGTTIQRVLPVVIDSGVQYSMVTTSDLNSYHTCGITSVGVLKCWGSNDYGQLGDGTLVIKYSPTTISPGTSYAFASVGYVHTCAIASLDSKLYCWGYNAYAQLGDYTNTNQSLAVQADTGKIYAAVTSAYNYTCGITTAGNLRCWGKNDYGQLGDGTITDRLSPIGISSISF